jgi:hypothetical protein
MAVRYSLAAKSRLKERGSLLKSIDYCLIGSDTKFYLNPKRFAFKLRTLFIR